MCLRRVTAQGACYVMHMFSERTQVLLSPEQRQRLERIAKRRQVALGVVMREAIDAYTAPRNRSGAEALDDLCRLEAPVSEWSAMKREILRGAGG